jgi:nitroreductase
MSAPITPDHLLRQLQWRYAVKRFDPGRRIPDATWAALEATLVLAPSSFGLQPWKFLVVETPALRQQLRGVSWNQPQVTDASHYVVFAGQRTATAADVDRMITATAAVRGTTPEALARYRQVIVDFLRTGWAANDLGAWNARQVYIALGQFLTAAAMLGVDTSPLEGIDCAAYDRLLGLDHSGFTTLCACAAGYRSADDRGASTPKMRYPAGEMLERR